MNKNQTKERLCSSFGSSRTVNLSRILPCGIQTLYLGSWFTYNHWVKVCYLYFWFVFHLWTLGQSSIKIWNFSFHGQIFQYYLLGLKACQLRFTSASLAISFMLKVKTTSLYWSLFLFSISWHLQNRRITNSLATYLSWKALIRTNAWKEKNDG